MEFITFSALWSIQLFAFHPFQHSVLIEGVKYNAEKPNMIAKTFLRLERDFDKHVTYCRDELLAQEFLAERDEVRNYFQVSEIFNGPVTIYHSVI